MKICVPFDDFERTIEGYLPSSPSITVTPDSKDVVFTDGHTGPDKTFNDSKVNYLDLIHKVLPYYAGWRFSCAGDMVDLLESSYRSIDEYPLNWSIYYQLHDMKGNLWVRGNHSQNIAEATRGDPAFSNAIFCDCVRILDIRGQLIGIIFHGHEADWWNHGAWQTKLIVNPIVKHVWPRLQSWFGLRTEPPFSPRRYTEKVNALEGHYKRLAEKWGIVLIVGHTHLPKMIPCGKGYYINAGSWCKPGIVTAVEVEHGKLTSIYWDQGVRREIMYMERA